MLYLFCYVLRVQNSASAASAASKKGQGRGRRKKQERQRDFDGGTRTSFNIDDFIHRMTLATGLDVKEVHSASGGLDQGRPFSIGQKKC